MRYSDKLGLVERRIYIQQPSDAPKGVAIQKGVRGGHYYDTKNIPHTTPAQPHEVKPVGKFFKQVSPFGGSKKAVTIQHELSKKIPNIPKVINYKGDAWKYEMDKMPGIKVDLAELTKDEKKHIYDEVERITSQIKDAGYLYPDIHTGNVMYDRDTGFVSLVDFDQVHDWTTPEEAKANNEVHDSQTILNFRLADFKKILDKGVRERPSGEEVISNMTKLDKEVDDMWTVAKKTGTTPDKDKLHKFFDDKMAPALKKVLNHREPTPKGVEFTYDDYGVVSDAKAGNGGHIQFMTPDQFLKSVGASSVDKQVKIATPSSLKYLYDKIKKDKKFGAGFLDFDGNTITGHEGRHHAMMAKILQIPKIPVAIIGKNHDKFNPDTAVPEYKETLAELHYVLNS